MCAKHSIHVQTPSHTHTHTDLQICVKHADHVPAIAVAAVWRLIRSRGNRNLTIVRRRDTGAISRVIGSHKGCARGMLCGGGEGTRVETQTHARRCDRMALHACWIKIQARHVRVRCVRLRLVKCGARRRQRLCRCAGVIRCRETHAHAHAHAG